MARVRTRGERRTGERRAGARLGDRQMRCEDCGTVWFSPLAETVAVWGRCIRCQGRLHVERRTGPDRRLGRARA
jgi:hypothetical protein